MKGERTHIKVEKSTQNKQIDRIVFLVPLSGCRAQNLVNSSELETAL